MTTDALHPCDVLIIGAGASGLMCAIEAGRRGRQVVVLDHAGKLAEKVRISGGGRCNFTNLEMTPAHFLSENPHFCRSALARYSPQDVIDFLRDGGVEYVEKAAGQLFSAAGAGAVIACLDRACQQAGVRRHMGCVVQSVAREDAGFRVRTTLGTFRCASLVIASGGLSIPRIGASPFGYRIAEQFGIPVLPLRPALVPLTVAPAQWVPFAGLSGLSLPVRVQAGGTTFSDQMLFTHRGLSGPAILQASSYWRPGQALHIDLSPQRDLVAALAEQAGGRKLLATQLAQWLPKALAEAWCAQLDSNKPLNQYSGKALERIAAGLHDWQIEPSGTLGYAKAEATAGGIDTRALSSKTMACRALPDLYFIGEVVDVTGQLGGYNLHWAWASGHAAGQVA